jgi:hypothetical protein
MKINSTLYSFIANAGKMQCKCSICTVKDILFKIILHPACTFDVESSWKQEDGNQKHNNTVNQRQTKEKKLLSSLSLHQELYGNHLNDHVELCQFTLRLLQNFRNVLLTDEAAYTNYEQVNSGNMHYCSLENPNWLYQTDHQR